MTPTKKHTAPFGSWASPISSAALTAATIGVSEPRIDGDCIYWLESRPEERGRTTIIQYREGVQRTLLPTPLNVRSKVNEYGGGSYCVHHGIVFFVLYDDQRIYRLDANDPQAVPEAITAANDCRYGDLIYNHHRQHILAIVEDHSISNSEAETRLVAINVAAVDGKQTAITLDAGADFYASPQLSDDGKQLLWLSWKHPNMPWDGTHCWLANIDDDGLLTHKRQIAGSVSESVVQPQFSPSGEIYFVSDRGNWWNLYRYDGGDSQCIHPMAAEFAGPLWVGGQSYYGFQNQETIVGCYTTEGRWYLYQFDLHHKKFITIDTPCTDIAYVQTQGDKTIFVGAGAISYNAIYTLKADNKVHKLAAPT